MPTSDAHSVAPIVKVFRTLQPRSVLDIGCGFGKYGVLLREYLDIAERRVRKSDWQIRIDGLDAFEGYRNPIWDFVYDRVYVGSIQELLSSIGRYDAVLIADMIEHLEKCDAVNLVQRLHEHCQTLVISTPKEFVAQPSVNGNDFEIHRCLWTSADYPRGISVVTIAGLACNVYVSSRKPIHPASYRPAGALDVVYLQSRQRLKMFGRAGWPVSAALRAFARLVT